MSFVHGFTPGTETFSVLGVARCPLTGPDEPGTDAFWLGYVWLLHQCHVFLSPPLYLLSY
jgi:hypothetical protein